VGLLLAIQLTAIKYKSTHAPSMPADIYVHLILVVQLTSIKHIGTPSVPADIYVGPLQWPSQQPLKYMCTPSVPNLCAHCNMLVHSLQGREVENLANDLRGFYFQKQVLGSIVDRKSPLAEIMVA